MSKISPIHRSASNAIAVLAVLAGLGQINAVHAAVSLTPKLSALSSKLSAPPINPDLIWKQAVVSDYQAIYGDIRNLPTDKEGLIRRLLTCYAINDIGCVDTSAQSIKGFGGEEAFPISSMAEVTHFGMPTATISQILSEAQRNSSFPATTVRLEAKPVPPSSLSHIAPIHNQSSNMTSIEPKDYLYLALLLILCVGFACFTYRLKRNPAATKLASNPPESSSQAKTEALIAEERKKTELERQRIQELELQLQQARTNATPADPIKGNSIKLLDALHRAYCDIEPFIEYTAASKGESQTMLQDIGTLESWRSALGDMRYELLEEFKARSWATDLPAYVSPETISEAMKRLLEHAAYFASLTHTRGMSDSDLAYWSREAPSAVMRMYWSKRTRTHTRTIRANPTLQIQASNSDSRLTQNA